MANKLIKRLVAVAACSMLVFGICFSSYGFISEALMVSGTETNDEETDPLKPMIATVSSVDLKLRTNSTVNISTSDNTLYTAIDYDTSFLDLLMSSADELIEKPFYDDKVVSEIQPYLNIRESADENGEVVGKLYPASYATIVEEGEEWTKIASGQVEGYVMNEYVLFREDAQAFAEEHGTEAIIVRIEEAAIHSCEDAESDIIAEAATDETYTIVMPDEEAPLEDTSTDQDDSETGSADISPVDKVKELYDEWIPVWYTEEQMGYVSSENVMVIMALNEAVSIEEEQNTQNETKKKTEETPKTEVKNESKSNNEKTPVENKTPEKTKPPVEKKPDTTIKEDNSKETAPPDKTQEEVVDVSVDDEYLLACLVYCESGNQSYEGQLAVANVVLNRVRSASFPGTISEVIYAPSQFGPASNGSLARALNNGPSSAALQAARDALAGTNNIGDFMYFNTYVDTSVVSSYTIIGDHTFYNY